MLLCLWKNSDPERSDSIYIIKESEIRLHPAVCACGADLPGADGFGDIEPETVPAVKIQEKEGPARGKHKSR